MKSALILAGTALILASPAALCSDLQPQEGQWEYRSEMPPEQKAMMAKMTPQMLEQMAKNGMKVDLDKGTTTITQCLNKEKIAHWHQIAQGSRGKLQCETPKMQQSGNTVTVDQSCSKPHAFQSHSVIEFSPARDAYRYEVDLKEESGKNTVIKGSARRIGDC